MKKILLGTTALALTAFAAPASFAQAPQGFTTSSGFSVTIGGFARQFVASTSQDNAPATARKGIDQTTDNRLVLTFRQNLSIGGTAGAVWQLNPNANTAGTTSAQSNGITRRQWAFLETQFGLVQLGGADNVAAQSAVTSFEAFTGGLVVGDQNVANWATSRIGVAAIMNPNNNHPTTGMDQDGIGNKIVYFTPRIEGFQLGVNYTPEQSYRNGLANTSVQYTNGWAGNLNFTRTFDGIGVRASVGYLTWDKPSGAGNTTAIQQAFNATPKAYNAGLGVTYMGFDLGGSYMRMKDFRNIANGGLTGAAAALTSTPRTVDGRVYELGLGYTFGPAAVSINYVNGNNDDAAVSGATITRQTNGKDKIEMIGLSGRYALGPGVNVNLGYFNAKYTEGSDTSTDRKSVV